MWFRETLQQAKSSNTKQKKSEFSLFCSFVSFVCLMVDSFGQASVVTTTSQRLALVGMIALNVVFIFFTLVRCLERDNTWQRAFIWACFIRESFLLSFVSFFCFLISLFDWQSSCVNVFSLKPLVRLFFFSFSSSFQSNSIKLISPHFNFRVYLDPLLNAQSCAS